MDLHESDAYPRRNPDKNQLFERKLTNKLTYRLALPPREVACLLAVDAPVDDRPPEGLGEEVEVDEGVPLLRPVDLRVVTDSVGCGTAAQILAAISRTPQERHFLLKRT